MGRLCSVHGQVNCNVAAKLVSALELSHLDYCSAILAGLSTVAQDSSIYSMQRVLHMAAQMVLELKPHDRVTPPLRELHRLRLPQRLTTSYIFWFIIWPLTIMYHGPTDSPALHMSVNCDFVMLCTCRRIGGKTFSVTANRILTQLKLLCCTSTFWHKLQTLARLRYRSTHKTCTLLCRIVTKSLVLIIPVC